MSTANNRTEGNSNDLSVKEFKVITPKKWIGSFTVEREVNGEIVRDLRQRHIGATHGVSEEQALEKLKYIAQDEQTRFSSWGDCFGKFFYIYLETRLAKNSPRQQRTVESICQRVLRRIGRKAICKISSEQLRSMLSGWAAIKGSPATYHRYPHTISKETIRKLKQHIRGTFDVAIVEGVLENNPMHDLRRWYPKRTKPDRTELLSQEQVWEVLNRLEFRDQIIAVLGLIGMLPSEIFGLRIDDFDGERLRVDETCSEGQLKAVNPPRYFDLTLTPLRFDDLSLANALQEWIQALPETDSDFIFPSRDGGPMHTSNFVSRHLNVQPRGFGWVERINFQMLHSAGKRHGWAIAQH